jgi:thiol-disulfide isomerase/thioredoxin
MILALACCMTAAPNLAPADEARLKVLLTYRPSFPGVEWDQPPSPANPAAYKDEVISGGFQVRDAQGKIVLRAVDRDGDRQMDQWSYFLDGFEVYREIDLNKDKKLDQVRWLNSGGTRFATISKGKIAGWTKISAEEASKVFVQALVSGDTALLETVMASPAELEKLGIPKAEVDTVAAAEKQRVTQVETLRAGVLASGWDANTVWLRLDGAMPRLIPADACAGLHDDLMLYENAVIFAGALNNPANAGRVAFLQVGEMVKVGDAWKFVDLPRVVDPNKNGVIAAVDGGIRSAIYRSDAAGTVAGENPQLAEALQALTAYEKANASLVESGKPKEIAQFHYGRIEPLRAVVKVAKSLNEAKVALDHEKLIVDSLAAAYATGNYAAGAKVLGELEGKGGKIGSYAAFKLIEADFALANNEGNGNNFLKIQNEWVGRLKAFIEKYPQSEEASQGLLFLASTTEMNGDEDAAKAYYARLSEGYPATEYGKKGAGALKRLDLVGKPISLKGTDLEGKPFDLASYQGKTVLVNFWATWATQAKRDLPELAKLAEKYKGKGFEVVLVSLDNDKAELDAYLKSNPVPWPGLFEPGGIESRLAVEYGVISLPTKIVVGPDGKVLNRSLRYAADLEIYLDKILSGNPPGVAFGNP